MKMMENRNNSFSYLERPNLPPCFIDRVPKNLYLPHLQFSNRSPWYIVLRALGKYILCIYIMCVYICTHVYRHYIIYYMCICYTHTNTYTWLCSLSQLCLSPPPNEMTRISLRLTGNEGVLQVHLLFSSI